MKNHLLHWSILIILVKIKDIISRYQDIVNFICVKELKKIERHCTKLQFYKYQDDKWLKGFSCALSIPRPKRAKSPLQGSSGQI